jgi:FMN phosphatase YigB (HAD superfamily)
MKRKILILFDVGAVLLKINQRAFYHAAGTISSFSAKEFEERYIKSRIQMRADDGEINEDEYEREIIQLIAPINTLTQKEVQVIVAKMWQEPIAEMIALKKMVYNAGYAVGIFSNISAYAYMYLVKKFPSIFEVYDLSFPQIYSYKYKGAKPNKMMYNAIKGYNTVIFIDDKEQYLEVGVKEYEWKGIHYTEHVDQNEPSRLEHPDRKGQKDKSIITANSVAEVKKALKEFGVYS